MNEYKDYAVKRYSKNITNRRWLENEDIYISCES